MSAARAAVANGQSSSASSVRRGGRRAGPRCRRDGRRPPSVDVRGQLPHGPRPPSRVRAARAAPGAQGAHGLPHVPELRRAPARAGLGGSRSVAGALLGRWAWPEPTAGRPDRSSPRGGAGAPARVTLPPTQAVGRSPTTRPRPARRPGGALGVVQARGLLTPAAPGSSPRAPVRSSVQRRARTRPGRSTRRRRPRHRSG